MRVMKLLFLLLSFGVSNNAVACNQVYDVIIIGLGTSGSVLANRLTEDPSINVLVIESGRDDTRLSPLLPIDLPNPMPNKSNNPWPILPRLGPLATIGQTLADGFNVWQHTPLLRDDPSSRYVWYPRGSSWGGSTIHNAGVALRGHSEIYDQWAALFPNNTIWSYSDILPYFQKLENRSQHRASFDLQDPGAPFYQLAPTVPNGQLGNFNPAIHGASGPVVLLYYDLRTAADTFAAALKTASAGGPFGTYPGSPIPVDVDPDDQQWKQYLTAQSNTAYDQFGSDFPTLDPYGTGPVAFPSTFGPVAGVAPRVQRVHAAASYIYPIQNRPNLTIISEALATKVIFDAKKRAVGVQYLKNGTNTWNIYQAGRQMNTTRAGLGGTPTDATANAIRELGNGFKFARATREVILCGGTYNSPQLLMLSGIGPAQDLENLGIKVVQDLPGVGQHLVDHGETDITWQHDTAFDFFALIGAGQLPESSFMTFDFKSDASQPFGNFSAHIYPGGITTGQGGVGDFLEAFFDIPSQGLGAARYDGPPQYIYPFGQVFDPPLNVLNHSAILLEQRANVASQGFVTLNSSDPTDKVNIVSNLLVEQSDMNAYIAAFRDTIAPFIQNLTPTGFFTSWVTPAPSDFLTSGSILLADKSNFDSAAFTNFVLGRLWAHHASGTCKMGPSTDPMAVTDVRGRVYGVQRLRVCDCSIFPIIPTSNTQIPAYMVGERMADLIKEDLPEETPIVSINPLVNALVANFGS